MRKTLAGDIALIDHYDKLLGEVALYITRSAKAHAVQPFARLQSVPGSGQLLALVILSEIHNITRFPRVQDFVSYCRLVKCVKESGGKRLGTSGKKIGNVPLRWAFAEAAVLFLRHNQPGQEYFTKLEHKHGKATALTVLAPKLARAGYDLLTREQAFDLQRVVTASPLRGETEPAVSLATEGESLYDAPYIDVALTATEHRDPRPGAPPFDWPVSPAHFLGAPSPSARWLPRPRV